MALQFWAIAAAPAAAAAAGYGSGGNVTLHADLSLLSEPSFVALTSEPAVQAPALAEHLSQPRILIIRPGRRLGRLYSQEAVQAQNPRIVAASASI